jgi:hypothetical protein
VAQAAEKENTRLVNDYLLEIQGALEEAKTVSDELQKNYLEPGWGILES